jgi:uncharacterized protein with PQ loop repeat
MNCTIAETNNPEDAEWARVFIWTANAIGFVYNVPQVVHTVRTKRTTDISSLFLIMRFTSSAMWVFYSSYFFMSDVLISWVITFISTVIIMYYKFIYRPPVEQPTVIDETPKEIVAKEVESDNVEPDYDIIVLHGE